MSADSDREIASRLKDYDARLRRLEGVPVGPALGEIPADFLLLPGLRGLWLPGDADETGAVYDVTGQGRKLTYNGNPTIHVTTGGVPFCNLDGTGDFFSRADEAGLEISGTETYVTSSLRGLTAGGWFRWSGVNPPSGDNGLIGKYNATGNNRAYLLYTNGTAPQARFIISTDGINNKEVDSSVALAQDTWYFIAGRFTPSTKINIIVNGAVNTNSSSIPASIFTTGTSSLGVGAFNGGGTAPNNCDWALAFLCAAAITDDELNYLFNRTRALFGV